MNELILKKALQLIENKIHMELRYIGGSYYLQYWDDEAHPIQILLTEQEYITIMDALKEN